MRWAEAERPEDVFGMREKPFRYGPRVNQYDTHLINSEVSDLGIVLDTLRYVAEIHGCELHTLIVGSCLLGTHADIDMLVGTYPSSGRLGFVDQTYLQLLSRGFRVEKGDKTGSVDFPIHALLLPKKIFAIAAKSWAYFDLNFVASNEDWGDVIGFHDRLSLVYSVVD